MKVKRMLTIRPEIYDRMEKVRKENGFMRSTFINAIIKNMTRQMNTSACRHLIPKTKQPIVKFQINVDLEDYEKIKSPKLVKIEWAINKVCDEYESGKKRFG